MQPRLRGGILIHADDAHDDVHDLHRSDVDDLHDDVHDGGPPFDDHRLPADRGPSIDSSSAATSASMFAVRAGATPRWC
jgi:hypothetical protein